MKLRTMFMAITMLVATAGFAQTDLNGRSYGGTHLDLSGSKASIAQGDSTIDGVSALQFSFALCYWYMLSNNLGVGLDIGYSNWSSTTPSFSGFETVNGQSQFNIAPSLYYFKYCYGDFGLTTKTSLRAGFGNRFNKTIDGNDETKTTDPLLNLGFQTDIGAFYAYQNFLFFAYMGALSLNYNSYTIEVDGGDSYKDNLFTYALLGSTKSFLLGMAWNLPFGSRAE